MKSHQLLSLRRRVNSELKKSSWYNYQKFLQKLLSSTTSPVAQSLKVFFDRKDFVALVEEADSISSTVYATAAEHRLANQLSLVIRKYPFPKGVVNYEPREKAIRTFLTSERKCSLVNRKFRLFDSLRSPYESDLSLIRSYIKYVLGPFRLSNVLEACDFGAGASIGVHGNATNMARKILSPRWSVTPSAFYYAQAALKEDALIFEGLTSQCGTPFYSVDADAFNCAFVEKASIVDYNKISFVPKTVKTERTIAVEPLLNGFLQKGVDVFMRKRLKRVGIDLEDQAVNRRLAREGSLPSTDPYVTIDLSSASDSISIGLCRNILPPEWFDYLDSIRSKSFKLGKDVKVYSKFCSMGNGFCFPLETLIFASVCNAVYRERNLTADFSVYGDDIILRQSVANQVIKLLGHLGFKTNTGKTFLQGNFRESCGADWFSGEDVRPITLDYAFDSIESIFKFSNIVRRKPALSCMLGECLDFLESLIPQELFFCRPFMGNKDSALEVTFDRFMASPYSRFDLKTRSWTWVELLTQPVGDKPIGFVRGYSVVLMRGALTGSKSSNPFTVRRKSSTKIRRISHWGISDPILHRISDHSMSGVFRLLSEARNGFEVAAA